MTVGDFDLSWWINGLSQNATGYIPNSGPTDANLKFNQNWQKFNDSAKAAWEKDLSIFNEMLAGSNGDPGAAIMYFALVLGEDMMNKNGGQISEQSDQIADLNNVSRAIAKLKQIFEAANGADLITDAKLTQEMKADLIQLKTYLQNDEWAAGDPSTPGGSSLAESIIPSLDSLLGVIDSGVTLRSVWEKAGNASVNSGPSRFVAPDSTVPSTVTFTGVSLVLYNEIMEVNPQLKDRLKIEYNSGLNTLKFTALPSNPDATDQFDYGTNNQWLFADGGGVYLAEKVLIDNTPAPTNPNVAPDPANLKKFLTAFDTMNSSATGLSNTYQGKTQYLTSEFTEIVNVLKGIQNNIRQSINSIQHNTQSS
jgi:hypothetical protein